MNVAENNWLKKGLNTLENSVVNTNVNKSEFSNEPKIEILFGGVDTITDKDYNLEDVKTGIDVMLKISNVKGAHQIRFIQISVFSNDDKFNEEDIIFNREKIGVPMYLFPNKKYIGRTDPPDNLFYYEADELNKDHIGYDYNPKSGICTVRFLDRISYLQEEPYRYTEFTTYIVKVKEDGYIDVIGKMIFEYVAKDGVVTAIPRKPKLYITSYFTDDAKKIIESDPKAYKKFKI